MAVGDRINNPEYNGYATFEITDETVANGSRQAARLVKIVDDSGASASPATAANQTTGNTSLASIDTKLGEVQASPTANTLLARLKDLLTGIVLAAGTNLIGRISSSQETSTIYNGTTALTPKFAMISEASANDNEVVAAVPTKKIRVLSYVLIANAAVNAKWRSATTDKSGLLYLAANGGASSGHSPVGHFETAAGEALNLHLSGAVAVGGHVTYIEV